MNWKRSAIGLVVALPLLALLLNGMGKDPKAIPSPLPGRVAPTFELQLLDPDVFSADASPGTTPPAVRLADHKGEVVVLNFFASWCLACRDEHPVLTELARVYQAKGVRFYGVTYNDKPEDSRRWIAEMGGQSYPALVDPGARTAIDYGLYGVPETFFLSKDGRVAFKQIGPVTPEILIQKLDSLLAAPAAAPAGRS